tara:strand:- start:285 stop:938 length:654 start_codon:yes stop_codon:yes gene_type:complete
LEIISRKEALEMGLSHYFTGRHCKYNHISPRFVANKTCKECSITHSKKWSKNNRESINKRIRGDRKSNPKKYRDMDKKRVRSDRDRERQSVWRKDNRDRLNKYYRDRYRENECVKMKFFMHKCIRRLITSKKEGKHVKTEDRLGYTANALKSHIERQFKKGMSWENYGEWHVDHIVPVSKFIKESNYNANQINALSNLRPLWAKENLKKGSSQSFLI